jgi:hypothetical protein
MLDVYNQTRGDSQLVYMLVEGKRVYGSKTMVITKYDNGAK